MKILFDQNVPRPLAAFLAGRTVIRAAELGWEQLSNGELLASAETEGFDVMITSDRNLRYQQKLTGRKLAIVVLPSGLWPEIKLRVLEIIEAVEASRAGTFVEILPRSPRIN